MSLEASRGEGSAAAAISALESWKVGKHGADVRRPDVSDLMIAVGNEHIGNFGHLLGPLRRDRRQDALELTLPHR